MAFVTGAIGLLITFLMLRRTGGSLRHFLAFAVGTTVSVGLFGLWIAFQLAGRPIGGYRTDWLAMLWAIGIGVALVAQIIAMLVARAVRNRAAGKVA